MINDIISKILDIEDKAQKIVKDARENSQNSVFEDEEQLKSEIESRTEKEISEIIRTESEKLEKRISEINGARDEQKNKLEEAYRREKDSWVKQIFDKIVS